MSRKIKSELDYVLVHPNHDGDPNQSYVEAFWTNVDRPSTGGIVQRNDVANRIADAMVDGVWFTGWEVRTDVDGNTYISATAITIGKYANSTLHKIGY